MSKVIGDKGRLTGVSGTKGILGAFPVYVSCAETSVKGLARTMKRNDKKPCRSVAG